ncbi:MAG: UbiA family prenyltransferase [Novosphingobium sp.]|nr:UbiA family prenyltransferase [Novosphingobium sp.]
MNAHREMPVPTGPADNRQDTLLVIALENGLLPNSLESENFWSLLAQDWRKALGGIGRAAPPDPATLALDAAAMERAAQWRNKGGRTALYAECEEKSALAIALHCGQFDMVLCTGGKHLHGADRAEWIRKASGCKNIADDRGTMALRGGPADYLKALRPHQWLKNALIFVPMAAAHRLDAATIVAAVLAFVAFSAIASGVYVLNDLLDLGPDRAHPRKCRRPFASGAIPLAHGGWMALALFGAGLGLALAMGPPFLAAMLAYFILTTAYSLHLKRRMVIDICILGLLYTMRIVAGGVATDIPLSVWLLAFSLFFFFSLAAVKRQAELVDNLARKEMAPSGRGYHVDDLPIISMMAIGAGYVSVLVMALYVNSPDVTQLYPRPEFLWGICCVLLFWITRTVMLAHRGQMHDDPLVYAAKDRTSLACGAAILACALLGTVA